jgi:hypothetical protein
VPQPAPARRGVSLLRPGILLVDANQSLVLTQGRNRLFVLIENTVPSPSFSMRGHRLFGIRNSLDLARIEMKVLFDHEVG